MNPVKVERDLLRKLTDLPNVGAAMAQDLELIGIHTPQQLTGQDPLTLYHQLCRNSGARQDPCVLDVLISITRFMDGDAPQPWWAYTDERKRRYGPRFDLTTCPWERRLYALRVPAANSIPRSATSTAPPIRPGGGPPTVRGPCRSMFGP